MPGPARAGAERCAADDTRPSTQQLARSRVTTVTAWAPRRRGWVAGERNTRERDPGPSAPGCSRRARARRLLQCGRGQFCRSRQLHLERGRTMGTFSARHWSNGANWAGVAPSGTVETLTFPALASPACTAKPQTATCYFGENDISGLKVNAISIDDGVGYGIMGNAITLGAGGLSATTSASGSEAFPASLLLPITLSASQSWSIDGNNLGFGVELQPFANVTGDVGCARRRSQPSGAPRDPPAERRGRASYDHRCHPGATRVPLRPRTATSRSANSGGKRLRGRRLSQRDRRQLSQSRRRRAL